MSAFPRACSLEMYLCRPCSGSLASLTLYVLHPYSDPTNPCLVRQYVVTLSRALQMNFRLSGLELNRQAKTYPRLALDSVIHAPRAIFDDLILWH